jgi:hypothetical protein
MENLALLIGNPGDSLLIPIGATNYSGTGTYLATNYPTVFSLQDNDAGVPCLVYNNTDDRTSITAEVTQLNTGKQYLLDSLECIGGKPPTPPWQRPKP